MLTNDLGLIAHFDGERLTGYTVAVGGGLGMTHNNASTYPRLATPVAFVAPDEMIRMVEAVIMLQRDHGDRTNRRRARLKYVVDDRGLPWISETLAAYFGAPLVAPAPLKLAVPDLLGWHEQGDGRWLARRAGRRRPHRRFRRWRGVCAPRCASSPSASPRALR